MTLRRLLWAAVLAILAAGATIGIARWVVTWKESHRCAIHSGEQGGGTEGFDQ